MRLSAFILLSCTFIMCKTKNVILTDQTLNFIVILTKDATPSVLKNDLEYDLANYNHEDKALNQWGLEYNAIAKDEKKIKAELLNHPQVVSVFSKDQFELLKSKKGQRSKAGSQGTRGATKQ